MYSQDSACGWSLFYCPPVAFSLGFSNFTLPGFQKLQSTLPLIHSVDPCTPASDPTVCSPLLKHLPVFPIKLRTTRTTFHSEALKTFRRGYWTTRLSLTCNCISSLLATLYPIRCSIIGYHSYCMVPIQDNAISLTAKWVILYSHPNKW